MEPPETNRPKGTGFSVAYWKRFATMKDMSTQSVPISFECLRNSRFYYRCALPTRRIYALCDSAMASVTIEAATAFGQRLRLLNSLDELRDVRLWPFDIVLLDVSMLPSKLPNWFDDRTWHERGINLHFYSRSSKPLEGLELHCVDVRPDAETYREFLMLTFNHNRYLRNSMLYDDLQRASFYCVLTPYYFCVLLGTVITLVGGGIWGNWLFGSEFGPISSFLAVLGAPYLVHAIALPLPEERALSERTRTSKLWIFAMALLALLFAVWHLGLFRWLVCVASSCVLYILMMRESMTKVERDFAKFVFKGDLDGLLSRGLNLSSRYATNLFRRVNVGAYRNLASPSADHMRCVFISHRNDHDGRQLSQGLYEALKAFGVEPYLDFLHLRGGSPFRAQLAEAFTACGVFISILTETEKIDWLRRELEFAYLKSKGFGYPSVVVLESGLKLERLAELADSPTIRAMCSSPAVVRMQCAFGEVPLQFPAICQIVTKLLRTICDNSNHS